MKIITTKEAAQQAGVTERRIRQMIADGDLKASKVGRDWVIPQSSLKRLKRRKPGPRPGKEKP